MKKKEKLTEFRLCRQYSDGEIKNEAMNLQNSFKENLVDNQAPRFIDKVGREYIDVPAIILGMQVIHGNGGYEFGAELVTENALWSSINQWNDKPVVIYHTDGSAREIENLVEEKVGFVHSAEVIGAEYDEEVRNPRIKVMLRLDVELLKQHGEDGQLIIDTFDSGNIMEMSTGYWLVEWLFQEGSFRGREFSAIQVEIMPDHLALLPNAVGAYSIQDGGGANRNNKGEPMKDNEIKTFVEETVANLMDEKLKVFPTKEEISEMVGNAIAEKLVSLNDAIKAVDEKVIPLVDNEKKHDEAVDEARVNLIAKVKEKTSSFSDEVLNATPTEVLENMLIENETQAIGRTLEDVKTVEVLGLNTASEKEAE